MTHTQTKKGQCPICGRQMVYDFAINPYQCKELSCPGLPVTAEYLKKNELHKLYKFSKIN